jgi:hypothetical protein
MKTDKKFDCVQMQRSIRNKISSDIEKMSNDKILEYIRKGSKAFEEKMARR